MRIALLSNPSSGRGRHAAADDVARRILTEAGHEVLHVRGSSYEQARDAGRALLGDGPHRNIEALVVVGGDGMVHGLTNLLLTCRTGRNGQTLLDEGKTCWRPQAGLEARNVMVLHVAAMS